LSKNDRCNPEQMRGTLALQGGEEVRISFYKQFTAFFIIKKDIIVQIE
jgi:hypothetical protein